MIYAVSYIKYAVKQHIQNHWLIIIIIINIGLHKSDITQ